MIIKMYKTTLLCLAADKEKALEKLQEMGVMHVEIAQKVESSDRPSTEALATEIGKVQNMLAVVPKGSGSTVDLSGKEIVEKALQQMEIMAEAGKRLDQLRRDREKLLPWGNFNPKSLEDLGKGGINVYLCIGSAQEMQKAGEKGTCEIISEEKGRYYFALFSDMPQDQAELPLVSLPQDLSLQECDEQIAANEKRQSDAESALSALTPGSEEVKKYLEEVQEKLDFLNTRDGMTNAGELAYLQGFVPVPEGEELKQEALKNGWALELEEASVDDPAVPTLVRIPKVFRIIEPMMKFLGIAPGYGEMDVSICFLFFLSIFFGMILGDAGYGVLLMVASTAIWLKVKNPELRRAARLMQVFSTVTIIWGWLCGSWFGISLEKLPEFMRGVGWLTTDKYKDNNVQLLCFTLAIMHLTTGRLWAAALKWGSIRGVLGEIGWALILWGNFFLTLKLLVFPGAIPSWVMYFYGSGLGLVVLCGINWKDPGDIFNFPFGVIGTFVDILSYIRLFAVGMSGAYIASSFNDMAAGLWNQSSPVVMAVCIVIGIGILLVGHGLNLALCFMGVLVHGVRLNTLEFSNHIGLRWAGRPYKAFSKQQK